MADLEEKNKNLKKETEGNVDKIKEKAEETKEEAENLKEKSENKDSDKESEETKKKINEKYEQSKNIADKMAEDLSNGIDDLIVNMKSVHKAVGNKINEYKQETGNFVDYDLFEDLENYYLKVAVPGVKKEKIDIEASSFDITICYEYSATLDEIESEEYKVLSSKIKKGRQSRTIKFSNETLPDEIKANLEKGILSIQIPKIDVPKQKINID